MIERLRVELLEEGRQVVKDLRYRNRQEKAVGDAAALRDIAALGRQAGLPEDEAEQLIREGIGSILDEFLPGREPSCRRRILPRLRAEEDRREPGCPGPPLLNRPDDGGRRCLPPVAENGLPSSDA